MKNTLFIIILPLFLLLSCQVSEIDGLIENIANDSNPNMTQLCHEVYGPEHYGFSSIYGEGTEVSTTRVLKQATDMSELQKQQVLKYGKVKELLWINSTNIDQQVNDILKNTDDENVLYTIIKTSSGKSYEQFRIYLGDTEVSGLFLKGTTFMVARTEDQWCEQDKSIDTVQDTNLSGTLARGEWKHYGPFKDKEAIKATLNVKPGVKASLYIRKNIKATWSMYDCRVRSYNTSDVSCAVNESGLYHVSIYTSKSTSSCADKSFDLTITTSKNNSENIADTIEDKLLKGEKHYYGPYKATSSFKAELNTLNPGIYVNLYVKKDSTPSFNSYDCRKSSLEKNDLACKFDETGAYYVFIYRSKSKSKSKGAEKEAYKFAATYDKEIKTSNEGKVCGSRGTIPASACGKGLFCKYSEAAQCGATDRGGVCTKKVFGIKCDNEENPVCGCDNVTYRNLCQLTAANVSIAHQGACEQDLAGESEECKSDSQCEEGLVCSNFNINDRIVGTEYVGFSMCIQEWMRNEFNNDVLTQIYAGSTKESIIIVDGLATVAMNAYLSMEIYMGWYNLSEELTFDIIAGNTGYDTNFKISDVNSSNYNINNDGKNQILTITDLPINFPGDDTVDGIWKLRITNSHNSYWINLVGWNLKISSRWD